METKKVQFKKACCLLTIFISFLFNSPVFSQGDNWKLSLNNNVSKTSGIGSSNYADLNFYTNGIKRFTISKDGEISSFSKFTVAGKIITDTLRVFKSIHLGLHSFNLVPDVFNGSVLSDQIRSTNGNITMGNDAGSYNNILVGVGTVSPGNTLDVDNNINVNPSVANNGYRINGKVVLHISGLRSIYMGENAGLNAITDNSGGDNIFIGFNSGLNNAVAFPSGVKNIFIGSSAGRSNISGMMNSFLGDNAGRFNTTGEQNSFFGCWAGFDNTGGSYNSFFGVRSGMKNTTGNYNSFFGYVDG